MVGCAEPALTIYNQNSPWCRYVPSAGGGRHKVRFAAPPRSGTRLGDSPDPAAKHSLQILEQNIA